jgi:hypothetical protein
MDCNGLYQGKIVKIFPRPGENPSTFRCTDSVSSLRLLQLHVVTGKLAIDALDQRPRRHWYTFRFGLEAPGRLDLRDLSSLCCAG